MPTLPNPNQIDPDIRAIVLDLYETEGLETDWSCQGGPGHMTIRPTIQIRAGRPWNLDDLRPVLNKVTAVMARHSIRNYWLGLVWSFGSLNDVDGELKWILQWPTQPGDVLCTALVPLAPEALEHWRDLAPINAARVESPSFFPNRRGHRSLWPAPPAGHVVEPEPSGPDHGLGVHDPSAGLMIGVVHSTADGDPLAEPQIVSIGGPARPEPTIITSWDGNSCTWEPLSSGRCDIPVTTPEWMRNLNRLEEERVATEGPRSSVLERIRDLGSRALRARLDFCALGSAMSAAGEHVTNLADLARRHEEEAARRLGQQALTEDDRRRLIEDVMRQATVDSMSQPSDPETDCGVCVAGHSPEAEGIDAGD